MHQYSLQAITFIPLIIHHLTNSIWNQTDHEEKREVKVMLT